MKLRRSLFWEVDPKDIDFKRHVPYVIERTVEFGTDAEVRWLWQRYPRATIRAVIERRRGLDPRTRALWRLLTTRKRSPGERISSTTPRGGRLSCCPARRGSSTRAGTWPGGGRPTTDPRVREDDPTSLKASRFPPILVPADAGRVSRDEPRGRPDVEIASPQDGEGHGGPLLRSVGTLPTGLWYDASDETPTLRPRDLGLRYPAP